MRLPNPHGRDIGRGRLVCLLRQARITREEGEQIG